MTSTIAPSTAMATHRRSQWQRSAGELLRIHATLATWMVATALVVVVVVLFTLSRFIEPQMSAVQFAYHGMLWFQFAMMIAVFLSRAGVHVANGMTRRSFIRGNLLAAAGTAVLYTVAVTLLLLVEQWLYDRLGWYHGLSNIDAEVLATGVGPYVWGAILIFAAGDLSGLLVAATYYRLGGWWGTLCLPLSLAPLLLISVFAMDHEIQWTPWDLTTDVLGPLPAVLAGVVLAGGVYAFHLLVRRMPISAHPS